MLYLQNLSPTKALLKLDFRNAFNSIRRDKMLRPMQECVPRLLQFVNSAYSSPSTLFWADKTIQLADGVQQGDPLGPLLFCLTIHHLGPQMNSELGDLGQHGGLQARFEGPVERVGAEIGLQLNGEKTEIICHSHDIKDPSCFLSQGHA